MLVFGFCFLYENDRLRGAVHLAGTALNADRDIDMGLRFTFCDRTRLTPGHAGTA